MAQTEETKMAVMQSDLGYIKKSVDALSDTIKALDQRYVTRIEFWPVKAVVYGGAGLVLVGVLAAIILTATNGSVHIQK